MKFLKNIFIGKVYLKTMGGSIRRDCLFCFPALMFPAQPCEKLTQALHTVQNPCKIRVYTCRTFYLMRHGFHPYAIRVFYRSCLTINTTTNNVCVYLYAIKGTSILFNVPYIALYGHVLAF